MFENAKEVDEETIIKEDNISLTRETNTSLLSGNVEYSDEMNYSLIIEGGVRKIRNPLVN